MRLKITSKVTAGGFAWLEDAPSAWLVFEPDVGPGLHGIRIGDEVMLITWLERAARNLLSIQPRGDTSKAQQGAFSTRSPHRPNPIGLHQVTITAVDGLRLQVRGLEALDGTPIVDLKPLERGRPPLWML